MQPFIKDSEQAVAGDVDAEERGRSAGHVDDGGEIGLEQTAVGTGAAGGFGGSEKDAGGRVAADRVKRLFNSIRGWRLRRMHQEGR